MPSAADTPDAVRGYTTADVARRYRIGQDKVRDLIVKGELGAISTAATVCGKPRYVILPHHLAEFERARQVSPLPKPARRKKQVGVIDYYPD